MKYIKIFLVLMPYLLIGSNLEIMIDQAKKALHFDDSLFTRFPLKITFTYNKPDMDNFIAINTLENQSIKNVDLIRQEDTYLIYFKEKYSQKQMDSLQTIFNKAHINNQSVVIYQDVFSKLYVFFSENEHYFDKFKKSIHLPLNKKPLTMYIILNKNHKKELKNTLAVFEIELQDHDLESQTDSEFIKNSNKKHEENILYQKITTQFKEFRQIGFTAFKLYSIYATFQSLKSLKSLPKMPHTTKEYIKTLWNFFIYLPTLISLYHYSKIGFGALKTKVFQK